MTAEGRKVSGNAFYSAKDRSYHHGTLLVDVDMERLSAYLQVSADKLKSKGVSSVSSRVANLSAYRPDMTAEDWKRMLVAAFEEVYGLPSAQFSDSRFEKERLDGLKRRYASWDWIYGRKLPFTRVFQRRFPWGNAEIQLMAEGGRIADALCYSDAMYPDLMEEAAKILKGCVFDRKEMALRLGLLTVGSAEEERIRTDLQELVLTDGEEENGTL